MNCSTPGFPVLHSLLEFPQTCVHWVSDAIQPSDPLLSPSPPDLSLSQHWCIFQWVDFPHHVAKVLELRFSISPSNEYSGLIFFKIDWLDLRIVQRTLKESSPAPQFKSIYFSVFSLLYVQLSHLYMTTGKTIALTIWTFASKVMSLFFNTLSKFFIAFLANSKHL